jgi:hypothetical protein|tara:strand:+ start:24319 stop:25059 length:741 start_codon:yes stop_codon:yes gene_type:complete
MEKLPISIGILAWDSGQTLVNTLHSYFEREFLHQVNDVCILFQEASEQDKQIAEHFGIPYIALDNNIGIGQGFIQLTEQAKTDNVLILEHDWKLIEDKETTRVRLKSGVDMLNKGYSCIRYRHRANPGHPHFSFQYQGRELDYYDKELEATSPHLLDSVHWCNPSVKFDDKIQKDGEYFISTSRWGNWTNNPCLYKKDFYLETVKQFAGEGIALEGNISKWWAQQTYKVAHGEGLFSHKDEGKHEN